MQQLQVRICLKATNTLAHTQTNTCSHKHACTCTSSFEFLHDISILYGDLSVVLLCQHSVIVAVAVANENVAGSLTCNRSTCIHMHICMHAYSMCIQLCVCSKIHSHIHTNAINGAALSCCWRSQGSHDTTSLLLHALYFHLH